MVFQGSAADGWRNVTGRRRWQRSRRAGVLVAVLALVMLTACRDRPEGAPPVAKRIGAFGTKVDAGSITAVRAALAAQRYVRSTDGRFYLLAAMADTVIAVYWKCPVEGCTVPPPSPALGGNLQCPCCGALYDGTTGMILKGPTNRPADFVARPLDEMPISLNGGNVIVDTGSVMTRITVDPHPGTPLR